ncbi:hypothetical protein BCU94_04100 [Shewanella sp. 10N.286.52.C2]|nr:hypothetical protein BCU94_04100 [Shewanella sp. 10N.286.52.C2]
MNKLVVISSALIAIALTGCSSAPQTNAKSQLLRLVMLITTVFIIMAITVAVKVHYCKAHQVNHSTE